MKRRKILLNSKNLNYESVSNEEEGNGNANCIIDFLTSDANQGVYPVTTVSFAVAEDDLPRVNAWFSGDYHGVTLPESSTLQKNRRAAIYGALADYFDGREAQNQITSTCRVGWRFRYRNGAAGELQDVKQVANGFETPVMRVLSRSIVGKTVTTEVEIRNHPKYLEMRVTKRTLSPQEYAQIEAIEVFATHPVALYNSEGTKTGLSSVILDGVRAQAWVCDNYSEESVGISCLADNDFRMIARIPIAELPAEGERKRVPMIVGTLQKFERLEKFSLSSGGEDKSTIVGKIRFQSQAIPIDTDYELCRLAGVRLEGDLPSDFSWGIEFSSNRDWWQSVATTTRRELSFLRNPFVRWIRIRGEGEFTPGNSLDAIVARTAD